MKYDRQLLLHGAKRNEVLDLDEVHAYGRDSYANPDYVCIYGLRPEHWYAKGIRLLGRTAVECTRGEFADLIGRDVAAVASRWSSGHRPLLIDPFAGSGSTLYWLARHLAVEQGVGFEIDPAVFALTKGNLATLALPIELRNDLRRTYPPIAQIAEELLQAFPESPLLLVVQLHETVSESSLRDLTARFDWHDLRIYDLLAPGSSHGILIAALRWRPTATADAAT
jgi:hypothetical protein